MPGAEQAIETAAKTGDWVVVLFVVLVLGGFLAVGVVMRVMWTEIIRLRTFVEGSLVGLIQSSAARETSIENLMDKVVRLMRDVRDATKGCPLKDKKGLDDSDNR